MTLRFDWKFWVVLVATVAGVLVPVWLWRADLDARSVHIRKLSQTSLQPPESAKALDLRVTVAGAELEFPYLTVFELVNDGARPVIPSDFETPIEITSKNKAEIVRTSVTGTTPADLLPSLSVEGGVVKIKPMLLNPGDSVTIAVLTTREDPVFGSRARIAGIRTVPIVDTQRKVISTARMSFVVAAGLLCLVAANLVLDGWPTKGVKLRPRAAFVVFLVAMFGAALFVTEGLDSLGVEGFWPLAGIFIGGMLLSSLISSWLNRPKSLGSAQSGDAV